MGLNLNVNDQAKLEALLKQLPDNEQEREKIISEYIDANRPNAFIRYINGIKGHPETWWIAILHFACLAGVFSHKLKMKAEYTQSVLAQGFRKILEQDTQALLDSANEVGVYILKYRKADSIGRIHGGLFTNYAVKGGRMGNRMMKQPYGAGISIANFHIASLGAIMKVTNGGRANMTANDVFSTILTGEQIKPFPQNIGPVSEEDRKKAEILSYALLEDTGVIQRLNGKTFPQNPVPINQFCQRPENRNLKSLCSP